MPPAKPALSLSLKLGRPVAYLKLGFSANRHTVAYQVASVREQRLLPTQNEFHIPEELLGSGPLRRGPTPARA